MQSSMTLTGKLGLSRTRKKGSGLLSTGMKQETIQMWT